MNTASTRPPETYFSRKLVWGFRRYVRRFIHRNFNAVRVANLEALTPPISGPLICFVNHPGWWDPMAAVLLTDSFFPARRFSAPMDAAALKLYPILERLGFFPLDRNSPAGLKTFLRYCQTILQDPATALWVTPTGRFTDIREAAPFMGGLGHLATCAPGITLIPVAIEYLFWNERYPEILIEFGPILCSEDLPTEKAARLQWLEKQLADTQASLALKAISRNPDAFTTLVSGRSGIGGLYDGLRRMVSFFTGATFQGRHELAKTIAAPGEGNHTP